MSRPSTSYHDLDANIVIIGAGVAGLMAAYALLQKTPSLNVLILEASNRIGGRLSTKPLLVKNNEFQWFDFGGQWISKQQDVVFELMNELEINSAAKEQNGKIIVDYQGKIYEQSKTNPFGFCSIAAKLEFADFIKRIDKLCQKLPLRPDLASMNMHTFIEQNLSHKPNKDILELLILIYCGVNPVDVTVEFYIFFCISTRGVTNQFTLDGNGLWGVYLQNGAQEICNKMAVLLQDDISLKTDTKVLQIKSNLRNVEIISTKGTFYGGDVIVAVPPSAVFDIKFSPPLSKSKKVALNNIVSGNISKFIVTYEEAFWRNSGYSGGILVINEHCEDRPLICCFDVNVEDNPALTGFFIKKKKNIKFVILEQLAQYFGQKALEPLQFIAKHWNSGSPMCCFKTVQDVFQMRCPMDRIFWAGAETSMEWYGTICGAIISGNRVAHDVLYDIRPAALSPEDMALFCSSLSTLKKRNTPYDDIYTKILSPFYQISAVILLTLGVIMWRKFHITARLKTFLIKK